ncbi:MAG: hypothetical protein LBL18_02370 [Bacteroidales bacterium]|jgi:glutaredoxin-related protein|nr:hypothetical protein [Bacteroidales bacterium]
MKIFLISIIAIVLLGCGSSSNKNDLKSDNAYFQYVKEYRKTEIDSIILHHDYTIIFAWTEWCVASHYEFKDHLKPFLESKSDNIGVISICCGDANTVANLLRENDCKYPTYLLSGSWSGLDKWRLNRFFHSLFDSYKSVNYVPVVILCNPQKAILNWNNVHNDYNGIAQSIVQIN